MPGKIEIKVLALFAGLFLVSCGSMKVARESREGMDGTMVTADLLKELYKRNLTETDFTIEKMRIYYEGGDLSGSFQGYLRHRKEGILLVSIRTFAGIEVARAYIDRDSVKINDRLKREYIYGSTSTLMRKYGLEWSKIGLLFGDMPVIAAKSRRSDCVGGAANITGSDKAGREITVSVDCDGMKAERITAGGAPGSYGNLTINYSDFREESGHIFPGKIVLNANGNYAAELEFTRYNFEDNPSVNFVRGRNYKGVLLK